MNHSVYFNFICSRSATFPSCNFTIEPTNFKNLNGTSERIYLLFKITLDFYWNFRSTFRSISFINPKVKSVLNSTWNSQDHAEILTMKLIPKICLLLLLFGVEAEPEDNQKSKATMLKERVLKNCSVCETENGRFFGDTFFTVFEFLDNLMIKNQEKWTRQTLKKEQVPGGESDKYNSEPFTDPQGAGSSMSEMSVYPVKMIGGHPNYQPNPPQPPRNMSAAMIEMKPKDPEPTSQNTLIHIWNGFKSQIDTILFSKFLLKLIVFKKIVKFMALICLLFFLPSLKQDASGRIFRDEYENTIDNRSEFESLYNLYFK